MAYRAVIAITALYAAMHCATSTEHHGHNYYGGGLDYSKWTQDHGQSVPVAGHEETYQDYHQHHEQQPHGLNTPVVKSIHKEVYAVKPVYEKTYDHEKKHLTVKFHKQPVLAYTLHPKGRSTTFSVPLFSAKGAPIVTLTNKFPKEW